MNFKHDFCVDKGRVRLDTLDAAEISNCVYALSYFYSMCRLGDVFFRFFFVSGNISWIAVNVVLKRVSRRV